MRKSTIFVLGIAAALLLPGSLVLAGSQNLTGGMYNVGTVSATGDPFDTSADGTINGRCAQERIWSTVCQGGGTCAPINGAACAISGVGSCTLGKDVVTQACNRGWSSNIASSGFPGYFSHTDNMTQFDPAADNYFVYILWENAKNLASPNALNYYYIGGQKATGGEKGRFQDANCTGTIQVSCFLPGTTTRHAAAITNVRGGTINNEGGLGPAPIPKITSAAGASLTLGWDAASYFDNGDGAPSPLLGYRLYQFVDGNLDGTCTPASSEVAPGWTQVGATTIAGTSETVPKPAGDCSQYSLVLVLDGPDNVASGPFAGVGEITTVVRGFFSPSVSLNPSVVNVFGFTAKYVGKNTFRLNWESGSESGLASYRIGRSTSPTGPFTVVGGDIPVKGDGQTYSTLDKVTRAMGSTFYYELQGVSTNGTTGSLGTATGSLPKKSAK